MREEHIPDSLQDRAHAPGRVGWVSLAASSGDMLKKLGDLGSDGTVDCFL